MKLKGSKLLDREAINNLISKRLNKVHFSKNLEPVYRRQYQNEAAYEFRVRSIIIFMLYSFLSYGIYQIIPAGKNSTLWFSLYVWVGIIILVAWILSFLKRLNQYFDLYTCIGSMFAVAISFIIVTVVGNDHNDALLHAAMMYAVVIIYAFVGMRFYTALIAGWFGGVIGVIVTKLFHYNIDWTFLNRTYTFSSFLGMALAYAIDRQHRENYLQNCMIELNQLEMKKQSRQLQLLSQIDSLTGLANRRHLSMILEQQWRYAMRHKHPLSIMMIDIDCFKNYNDHLGHQAGDQCLKLIAQELLTISSRSGDLAARYGGEEFLVLIPMFDEKQIESLAEYLIHRIHELKLPHPASSVADIVTISIGTASIKPNEKDDLNQFIRTADNALYSAKAHGRNQYCIGAELMASI